MKWCGVKRGIVRRGEGKVRRRREYIDVAKRGTTEHTNVTRNQWSRPRP